MHIRWGRILGLFVLIGATVLLLKLIKVMEHARYYIHMPDYLNDPHWGLCFFGLLCVSVVAIVRILSNR